MSRRTYALTATALAIAFAATGCGSSSDTATKTETKTVTESASSATSSAAAPTSGSAPVVADLPTLIPSPDNVRRNGGPDPLAENGIHKYFEVGGTPAEAMNSYKAILETKGWALTVWNSGGGNGGGGATYSGTNGTVYGVFTGGGYGDTTHIQACAWPSKPANPECGEQ